MSSNEPRVVAITPSEVMEVRGEEQKDVDKVLSVMNDTLRQSFDGKNLEVMVPIKLRCALLAVVASQYRSQGWGVKVDYQRRSLLFWNDKRKKVELPDLDSPEAVDAALDDPEGAMAVATEGAWEPSILQHKKEELGLCEETPHGYSPPKSSDPEFAERLAERERMGGTILEELNRG